MNCEICGKSYSNYKGLSGHIRQTHNMTSEEYYLKFIDSNNICPTCSNHTHFKNLSSGFTKYCCVKCSNSNEDKIKIQNTTFRSKKSNIERARNTITIRNKSIKARETSSKIGKRTGRSNLKTAHQNDSIRYCEKCNSNSKHIIGIGCMTCYNRNENHKQSIINTIKD